MSELRSALDALAADDVRTLPPRQQLDEIVELLEERNRIDARLTRRVRAAELQRTKRVVPPHIRRAVEPRDEACVFAGCGARRSTGATSTT